MILIRINREDQVLVPYFITRLHKTKSQELAFQMDGTVHFPEEIVLLKGKSVYLPVSEIQEESPDFHPQDLLGFMVRDKVLGQIGKVEDYYESAAHPILAVTAANGNEVMIPLIESMIVSIYPETKEIEVDCPEGLIDLYLSEGNSGQTI